MSAGASKPRISVIVPVYNAAGTIAGALDALRQQDLTEPYEVIFVEGGSTDGSWELLRGTPGIRLIENPERNPASARNLGARHAQAATLAFTDADCEPDPGWLRAGLEALGSADLVQGRVTPQTTPGPYDRTVSVGAELGLYETANLFVQRATFERANGFDQVPGLRLQPGEHFGEDVLFAWRARRAGARTAFASDAEVRHAVFPRSATAYIAERRRARYFPALTKQVPELRDTFLTGRYFLSRDSRAFDLAVAGLIIAALTKKRWPAAAALPYARSIRRRSAPARYGGVRQTGVAAVEFAADATTAAALIAGSITARTPLF